MLSKSVAISVLYKIYSAKMIAVDLSLGHLDTVRDVPFDIVYSIESTALLVQGTTHEITFIYVG